MDTTFIIILYYYFLAYEPVIICSLDCRSKKNSFLSEVQIIFNWNKDYKSFELSRQSDCRIHNSIEFN